MRLPLYLRQLLTVIAIGAGAVVCLSSRNAAAQASTIQVGFLSRETIEHRIELVQRKNEEREQTLKSTFAEAGCNGANLSEQRVDNPKLPNVICTLPGSTDSTIVVAAHFDHVDLGDGVVDNWSGAALLPSFFETLHTEARKHTLLFVGFTEEEKGLVGSRFYVKHLTPEQTAKIRVMVNLDSVGLGPTKIWLTHSDQMLAETLAGVARAIHLPLAVVNADQVGDEDSSSFRAHHIPTVMLHSITQENLRILHTVNDKKEKIQMSDYFDTYRLVAAYLVYLDGKLE